MADLWSEAGRALLAKLLGELAYEELVEPTPEGDTGRGAAAPAGNASDGWVPPPSAASGSPAVPRSDPDGSAPAVYRLALGGAAYRFDARRGAFGVWRVDPGSITRDGATADDPLAFVLDAREVLRLDGPTAAEVVRELTATLAADAKLLAESPAAAELADLPYLELEGHQSGHPCMVLNKGRLGFSASDVERYAPESRRELRLRWIAVDEALAAHAGPIPHDTQAPPGYVALPVHPFHWDEAVAPLFARELADGRMLDLGEGEDRYRPLQSIRTLANVDRPERHDVKLTLMVRNTLVWRGLAPQPTLAAPAISGWLKQIQRSDPLLRDMILLGEIAGATVRHPVLDRIPDAPYRYHELLGAVWREPVRALLRPGEQARTMAALLHVDRDGSALAAELVARSNLDATAWLQALLDALLPPLVRFLCGHGVAFCPHGENTVLIFDEHEIPRRIAIKDFAEDVNLLPDGDYPSLPPEADAVLLRWPAQELAHSILSAILAGHFRFFAEICERHLDVPEPDFWALVHATLSGCRESFGRFDLLPAEFDRVCLNREHLLGGGFHDRAERDEGFDVVHGRLRSPW